MALVYASAAVCIHIPLPKSASSFSATVQNTQFPASRCGSGHAKFSGIGTSSYDMHVHACPEMPMTPRAKESFILPGEYHLSLVAKEHNSINDEPETML